MASQYHPRLAITYGDPAGIGPEIVARALGQGLTGACPVVYGDSRVLARGAEIVGQALPEGLERADVPWAGRLPEPGRVSADTGRHAYAVLERLGEDLRAKRVDGVVTGPIHKAAILRERPGFIGHTEFFAAVGQVERFGMLLVVEPFRALHVTTHMALADVPKALTVERIVQTIELAGEALQNLGEADRGIGVCGLNPHAGEEGAFGDEEARVIGPAIAAARARGLCAVGPLPPDTAFPRAAHGEFGVVVCMYHDQGHVPLKLIGFERGVNVTVGLPFVRTSVDHGTALDLAGKGSADASSLRAAWEMAIRLSAHRAAPRH